MAKELTKEELSQLEEEGYSCGDCSKWEACKSLGITKYGFICYSFDNS